MTTSKAKKADKQFNYELVIVGLEVNLVARTMTERQVRDMLEHFVKYAGLKDISFSVKRLTPEPFSEINAITTMDTAGNDITYTPSWTGSTTFNP